MIRPATFIAIIALSAGMALGCATDEPRYADPPPGSHSPGAASDERTGGDQMRDEPEPEPDVAEEEEPEEPMPELN